VSKIFRLYEMNVVRAAVWTELRHTQTDGKSFPVFAYLADEDMDCVISDENIDDTDAVF